MRKKLKIIDDFINFRTTLIFSIILFIFVILYDYLLSIILFSNCVLNYFLTVKIISNENLNIKNKNINGLDYHLIKIKNDNKLISYIKPFINTFTMFCIMTSVLIREDITISFILIFLIRIYLNKINGVIINTAKNPNFKNSISNQLKLNIFNN